MLLNYAQVDDDGVVRAVSQLLDVVSAPNMVLIEQYDTSLIGMRWDAVAQEFVPGPQIPTVPPARRVSVLAFRRRYTSAERAAIEWAAVDRPDQSNAQRQQAAALRSQLADQAAATFIDLDDADTVQGVQGLEALGHIATGRALEILTAPIQPEELP